jgi:class 3 adenylate cyclase
MTKALINKYLDPSLTKQDFSARIYKGYIVYLKKTLGDESAKVLIEKAGLPLNYLENDQNWVSEKYAEEFYSCLEKEKSLPLNYSYLAAKESLSKEVVGPLISVAMSFMNIQTVYKQILKLSKQYNKADVLDLVELSANSLVLKYTINRRTKHSRQIVNNWEGFLENIPLLFQGRKAKVKTKVDGDRSFTFSVTWSFLENISFLSPKDTLFLLAYCLIFSLKTFLASFNVDWIHLLFGALVLQILTLIASRAQKQNEISKHYNSLKDESESRFQEVYESKQKLDRRYQEANLLREVLTTITKSQSEKDQIETTLEQIQKRLGYDRVIYFSNIEEQSKLKITCSLGFDPILAQALLNYSLDLKQVTPNQLHLGNVFKTGQSILVPVASEYINSLSEEARYLLLNAKTQSFLAVPVKSEKTKFGVLLVDYFQTGKSLSKDDLHIIENVSIQLGIALQNTRNYESEKSLRLTFQKFVPAPVLKKVLGGEANELKKGYKKNVTVLFSDLRDFTKNSNKFSPENIVSLLNYYFNEMNQIVYSEGGIVDKFMGDGLFAIFNAFEDHEDHCDRAIRAALKMQEKINEINSKVLGSSLRQFPKLESGMGIHTGVVTLCTLGNDEKTEFTAIGETVNIAARLEGKAKEIGRTAIVVSKSLERCLKNRYHMTSHGVHHIRGIEEGIELLSVESPGVNLSVDRKENSSVISFNEFKNSSRIEKRFQRREILNEEENIFVEFGFSEKVIKAKVIDISSFGCRALLPIDVNDNLKEALKSSGAIPNLDLFFNNRKIGAYQNAPIIGLDDDERFFSIKLFNKGNQSTKRSVDRIALMKSFEIEASFSHPLKFESIVNLKCNSISAKGASFICSARNNLFFVGLKIPRIFLHIPSHGSIEKPFETRSVEELAENKIKISGIFCEDFSAEEAEVLGAYVLTFGLFKTEPRIEALNRAGISATKIKSVATFSLVDNSKEKSRALKIRTQAYANEGKYSGPKLMEDTFDAYSRIVLAKLGNEDIGTVRVTFSKNKEEPFELESSIELPNFIDRTKTIEVSRLAVYPAYQRTDLVLGLVQRAIEIGVKAHVQNVITSCTEEKIPIYRKLGFLVSSKSFTLETLKGIPHFFLRLPTNEVVPTGSRNPFAWHFTYGPMVTFLRGFGYYSEFKVSLIARVGRLLLPLVLLYKKSLRKKKLKKVEAENKGDSQKAA